MDHVTLFASDFDGTLFFREQEPPIAPDIPDAIDVFRRTGGRFGYCTGRPFNHLESFHPDVPKADFIISSNGAVIVDAERNRLFERSMSRETAEALLHFSDDEDILPSLHSEGEFFNYRKVMTWAGVVTVLRSLEELGDRKIHQVSLRTPGFRQAGKLTEQINREMGEVVTAFQNVEFIDIVPVGCSKGKGLLFMKEQLRTKKTFGIGDSLNDIPLLDAADTSYTFGSSPKEVQVHADHLVRTLTEALSHASHGGV